ncbi:MAG: putative glycosyltransferase [Labilithrix sp.]|nr:putative glycosyltransferase [Labilithrix sp.]
MLPGFTSIEVIVIDDGSTDGTVAVARRAGVAEVVRAPGREGLARAFVRGLDAALRRGADVIVNTDGDNQYDGGAIGALVGPIVLGKADMVVGDRGPSRLAHFDPAKRLLSNLGSRVVGAAAGARIPDAASGFRALTRAAALRLVVVSDFTYTHETLIQAIRGRMAVAHVPVGVRHTPRKSRLAASKWSYITSSAVTIVRTYAMYRPLRVFVTAGAVLGAAGTALGARFLYYFVTNGGAGHVQSLLLTVLLVVLGFLCVLFGILADVMAGNRRLVEEVLWRVRSLETASAPGAPAARRFPQGDDLDAGLLTGEREELAEGAHHRGG